ncbi:MAG: dephospho-CoA kinase [Eubacteriales bacterium]|nr:dephospho-CoA kinase [Eubacteriales bacterium]NLO15740.1 dephospho-CoA kinase [Clostridiales bacterium]
MKANRSYIIGLTGGIACGKSNVARMLKAQGCPIIDTDKISHALTAPNGPALPFIRAEFGDSVFADTGELNRAELASVVFSSPDKIAALNAILHPMIFAEMERQMLLFHTEPLLVLEIPLLYETGAEKYCDEVWAVYVQPEEQLRRLMRRNTLTRVQALGRITSQMPALEKARRADAAIDTSGSYAQTAAKVKALWNDLLRRLDIDQSEYPAREA